MAEFKKLSDVEVVAEPAESANVLIEENGVIKKAPKTAIGGGSSSVCVTVLYDAVLEKTFTSENAYLLLEKMFDNFMNINLQAFGRYDGEIKSYRMDGIYKEGDCIGISVQYGTFMIYADNRAEYHLAPG